MIDWLIDDVSGHISSPLVCSNPRR
jgi:hypothetical protein